jgi:hypothetical protein
MAEALPDGSLGTRGDTGRGLRLVVNDGSAEALGQLIQIERDCCRWITFQLEGPVVLMTAEGDAASAVRAMWEVDLSPERD